MTSSSRNDTADDSGVRYFPYRITCSQSRQSSQLTSQLSDSNQLPLQPTQEHLSSVAINSAREKLLTFKKAREEGEEVEEILMGRWNDQDLDYGTDATAILGQNIAKESDFWVRPRHRPDPPAGSGQGVDGKDKAYPTMMIEVGFSQSLPPDPHQIAALYFNRRTTIQIVLTIKIFGKRINTNTNTTNPDTNIVKYIINQMGVPSGFPIVPNTPPAGFAAGFNLDLWEVQDIIRRHI
ncbi:6923_t:CDS:2 [Rhizophagus irregularis]|nr:6923_t:CDS:2 [Rhizophagus irregularis]